MDPLLLGHDCVLSICRLLDVKSVLLLGACSKGWLRFVRDADGTLWQQLCARDLPQLAVQVAAARDGGASWAAAYQRAYQVQALRCLLWEEQFHIEGRRPRAREGHAACPWGQGGMLLTCGFGMGGGALADLQLLLPAHGGGSTTNSSSRPSSRRRGDSSYRWVQPQVAGRFPVRRYGHSVSRCVGAGGEQMAVLFGGLLAGGYQAALDTIAVLRLKQPAAASEATAATTVAGTAAARGGSSSSSRWAEERTSLDLAAARAAGGAPPSLAQLLWDHREMLMGHSDGDDSDGEEGDASEEGYSDWEDEDDDSDYVGWEDGGGEEEEEQEGQPRYMGEEEQGGGRAGGSSSGRQEEGEEEEGEQEFLPARSRSINGSDGSSSGASGSSGAAGGGGGGTPRPAAHATGGVPDGRQEEWQPECEYEWVYPEVKGEAPGARGYHSAAVSEDGTQIWFFGGLAEGGSCNLLAMLDVTTWTFSRPVTSGDPPPPRCGHSSCIYGGKLWVVGGGSGFNLLHSGQDLADVYCLDLATLEWRKVAVPEAGAPQCAGKCHCSVLVGSRLLLFGGSMATCNDLAWLDLDTLTWGAPHPTRVLGEPPFERMSATAVLAGGGDEVLVFGGYTFHEREVGDLYRLKLLPTDAGVAAAEAAEVAAAAEAAAAASSVWRGGRGGRQPGLPHPHAFWMW